MCTVDTKCMNIHICLPSQFYFGDRNYSKDKFLKDKAEEDDGCILKYSCKQK